MNLEGLGRSVHSTIYGRTLVCPFLQAALGLHCASETGTGRGGGLLNTWSQTNDTILKQEIPLTECYTNENCPPTIIL